jgi:hypothetical protein
MTTFSYTQISQYLGCPRKYRHRYLDGWQEKDTRAAMVFGRAFEQALGAYFRREDPAAALFKAWAAYQHQPLHYSERDSWDRMLQQGVQLLERFCQEDRVRIRQPRRNLQISSNGRSQPATTSLPTSTPSDSSMAAAVCWNGRPPRPATRKNRMAC